MSRRLVYNLFDHLTAHFSLLVRLSCSDGTVLKLFDGVCVHAFIKGKRIFIMLEIHDYEKFQKVKPVEVGRPLNVTGNTEG